MKNVGWSRRTFIQVGGTLFGGVLLTACAPDPSPTDLSATAIPTVALPEPSFRFAYAGAYTRATAEGRAGEANQASAGGISVLAVTADSGQLTYMETVVSDNPTSLVLDPTQRYLYVCNEIDDYEGTDAGSVEAYAVDDNTGKLTLLNRQSVGALPVHLAMSPEGDYLVVAAYRGGSFQLLPIRNDGNLWPVIDEIRYLEETQPETRTSHPRYVCFDPNGRYLVTLDAGAHQISSWRVENGHFRKVGEANLMSTSTPSQLDFHPSAEALYVNTTDTLATYAYNAESGAIGDELQTLSTYSDDGFPSGAEGEIWVHPSGRFLYAITPLHAQPSVMDTVLIFSIDPATRTLRAASAHHATSFST